MMGSLAWFLFVYILGGLSFLPLLLAIGLLYTWHTFPICEDTAHRDNDVTSIIQPGDDVDDIKRAQNTLGEPGDDGGRGYYFTVVREYTPGMDNFFSTYPVEYELTHTRRC